MSEGNALQQKQQRIRHRLIVIGLLLLVAVSLFAATAPGRQIWRSVFRWTGFSPQVSGALRIHVLDVGKADSILIQCDGHTALVDAGTYPDGETVVDYLARCGVESLDYLIITHPDKDHLGGASVVLSEMDVGAFVRSKYFSEEYGEANAVLAEKSIPLKIVSPGDMLSLGGASLRVIGPLKEYEETNDSSLVFRLEFPGFSALFCGDIEEEAELDLLKASADLSADLLKVAHHGSNTSSKKKFLKAVDPDYAVISVGPDNNDLPSEKALLRLEDTGAELYRTDTDGNIVFAWDGEHLQIETEKRGIEEK